MQLLNYMGNLGIVRMAMEISEGRAMVALALAGLLEAGLTGTHVWVQKFRKHLNGGTVEPGLMLMPSGATLAREDAEDDGEAEGEANASNSSKQVRAMDLADLAP